MFDLKIGFATSFLDYADLKGKSFFPGLIKYMASGPVVGMVWQGLDAVKTGRAMLGATNPLASATGPLKLIEFFRWLTLIMQVQSVVITVLQLVVMYAMAPTRLRVLKKRLLCKCFFFFTNVLIYHLSIISWFPEGVVQYTSALEAWVSE